MRLAGALLVLSPLLLVSARKDPMVQDMNVLKTTRIIGGSEAEEGRYPYAVSVQMGGEHYCGGSLIAKDVVLTAAHCLQFATSAQAVIGRTDITKTDEGDQIAVTNMIIHPDFDSNGTWEWDFALLVLARPTIATNAQLIELNVDENYPESGTVATTMGWGDLKEQSDKYESSDTLMVVEADTMSNEECSSADGKLDGFDGSYDGLIFPSMICTMSKKQNACKGDSGGPLVVLGEDSTKDRQIGIISWSMPAGCATKVFPVVYSRVSTGIEWFKKHVCSLSAEPPGSLCGTPEPTDTPSKSPTETPSLSPMVPTMTPTENPTIEPTETPTVMPTKSPTQHPTTDPTKTPTAMPTKPPTANPTESPSTSIKPSSLPSELPTHSPSNMPSNQPSISMKPSVQPTSVPSVSAEPTGGPTQAPTVTSPPTLSTAPSSTNSPTLSIMPTSSAAPTEQPSNVPSQSQAPSSSLRPTILPSMEPTGIPTKSHLPTATTAPSESNPSSTTSAPTTESELNAISKELSNAASLRLQKQPIIIITMSMFAMWALIRV